MCGVNPIFYTQRHQLIYYKLNYGKYIFLAFNLVNILQKNVK